MHSFSQSISQSPIFQNLHHTAARAAAFFYGSPERTRLTMVLVFTLMVMGISLMEHSAATNACYL
jgi:hypothetical protein